MTRAEYLEPLSTSACDRFWLLANHFQERGPPWNNWMVSLRRTQDLTIEGAPWSVFCQLIARTDERSGAELWATMTFQPSDARRGSKRRWERRVKPLVVRDGYTATWWVHSPDETTERLPSQGIATKRLRRSRQLCSEARRVERILSKLTGEQATPLPRLSPTGPIGALRAIGYPWLPFIAGYERRAKRSIDGGEWTANFKIHVMADEAHPGHRLPRLEASVTIWPPKVSATEAKRLPRTRLCRTIRRSVTEYGYTGRWRNHSQVGFFGDFWKHLHGVREAQREARRLERFDLP